jgi:hypothetical protein
MSRACSTHRRDEKFIENFGRPICRWKIILEQILGK